MQQQYYFTSITYRVKNCLPKGKAQPQLKAIKEECAYYYRLDPIHPFEGLVPPRIFQQDDDGDPMKIELY